MKKAGILILTFTICLSSFAQKPIANTKAGEPQQEEPLELFFSIEGGYFNEEIEVRLFATDAVVYYTLDGSTPTKRSPIYKRPISIKKSTVLRAFAKSGKKSSAVLGHTYFINEPETNFPVVSIGIAPWLLFNPTRGMFMQGSNVVDTLWKKPGANFWSRKEVACNIEIFETDGRCVYNNITGFRLFGGMSRLFPQKSIALVARKRFGDNRFRHKIFGKDGPKSFKFLVLRNSGSDFGKTHFRDALMTGLLEDWDIEKQAYRPSHVYINGTYWGIYNIREKVNRYFIAAHQDVDKDSIDLLEHRYIRKRGSKRHYRRMIKYLEDHDLSDPVAFEYIQTQMEVDNFLNYQIAQIFFDNRDAGGNIKYWRPQTPDGRWRWILYDTDWGFGLHEKKAYRKNSLVFHTEPNGPNWPNPPWSTFILRRLLENPTFESNFINRFADHLNTTFHPYQIEKKTDEIYQNLKPEIPRHLDRWNLSLKKWENQVGIVRHFAEERATYMRMYLMERFETGRTRRVAIEVSSGGTVTINNNVKIREKGFDGRYFEKIPITIRATADYGYRFSHWEGIEVDDNVRELYLQLSEKSYRLKAVFEPFTHPLVDKVMINEICPFNRKSGDWVEIFNYTKKRVALKNWVLTDLKNEFVLPDVSLDPNDYLVICRDSIKFTKAFPEAYNVIGGLNFGLNKREEQLGLYSALGAVVDSVGYSVMPTDSAFTLSLLLPYSDNGDFENWIQRIDPGSPNAANPYYVESSIRIVQEQWMQIGAAAGVVLICMLLLFLRHRRVL